MVRATATSIADTWFALTNRNACCVEPVLLVDGASVIASGLFGVEKLAKLCLVEAKMLAEWKSSGAYLYAFNSAKQS